MRPIETKDLLERLASKLFIFKETKVTSKIAIIILIQVVNELSRYFRL